MADLDLEFDGPSRAPSRPSRFAPKGSKFKPKVEPVVPSESKTLIHDYSATKIAAKAEEGGFSMDNAVPMDVDAKPELILKEEDAKPESMPKDEDMEVKEEEGDVVVREIDVYYTPPVDPNTKLYVLQYPLRPIWRPYELEGRCQEVRIKSGHAEMEVDLAIDVDSNNYDRDAEVKIDKQTLVSSCKSPIAAAYAVGVLVDNKLHLNPLHAVLQLRPTMTHHMADKRKSGTSSGVDDSLILEENDEKKSGGASKKQNKAVAAVNEENKDTAENWLPLKYHGMRSNTSGRYLQEMIRQEASPLQFSMSRPDYVDTLCPVKLYGNAFSKGLSERILRTLEERFSTWQERLKAWLIEGPRIHHFNALKHLAPHASVEEFLRELRKHGRLVQGLWVPTSQLLYGRDEGEDILTRDYILLQFSKNPIFKIENLPFTKTPRLAGTMGGKLNEEIMRGTLNDLASEKVPHREWKFKEPADINFIKLYPDVVKEEQAAWKQFESSNFPNWNDKKISNYTNRVDSRMLISGETREALKHAIQKLFHSQKVCSSRQICQRLRAMALSESFKPKGSREAVTAALSVDKPTDELKAIISQVCIDIHGVYVLKSSPDNPDLDDFRNVVIDLLIGQGPNAKLKKASIKEAAKQKLGREIKDADYLKVVQELCVSQNSAWVLKCGEGNSR